MDLVVSSNTVYAYAVTWDGKICKLAEPLIGITNNNNRIPENFELKQNYPNPFNPSTRIDYELPEPSNVSLIVYDILGNNIMELLNAHQDAGTHTVIFDASKLSSGIYFYTLRAGNFRDTKKMIVLK